MAPTTAAEPYFVFVYGTLTDPDRVAAVLPEYTFHGPAVLDGLHRVEGRYPTLAPDGTTEGRLLETPTIESLDEYEGVHAGLYVRCSVPMVPDHENVETAEVYVGDPALLDAPADWPGSGSFADRVHAYVQANDVRLRSP
ncbi:MAG: gamma-glutamylcyclotransferase family protein [Halobacteriales archaeon]|nr:gamma-glutamylcyclotransferase family protein [Halobacteriales archaeon]